MSVDLKSIVNYDDALFQYLSYVMLYFVGYGNRSDVFPIYIGDDQTDEDDDDYYDLTYGLT